MNALERARAELAGGDVATATMFALFSIAESLEAMRPQPLDMAICPECLHVKPRGGDL